MGKSYHELIPSAAFSLTFQSFSRILICSVVKLAHSALHQSMRLQLLGLAAVPLYARNQL